MFAKTTMLVGILMFVSAVSLANAQDSSNTASDGAVSAPSIQPGNASARGKKEVRAQDRKLGKAVKRAIYTGHTMDETDIAVFAIAKTGAVILSGFVDEQSQEQKAVAAAKKVSGVSSVTSKVTLRYGGN